MVAQPYIMQFRRNGQEKGHSNARYDIGIPVSLGKRGQEDAYVYPV